METKLEKDVRFLKIYATVATLCCTVFFPSAFANQSKKQRFEEIDAGRINILDSTGKTRVILAGEFPKPRANLAGLIFTMRTDTKPADSSTAERATKKEKSKPPQS